MVSGQGEGPVPHLIQVVAVGAGAAAAASARRFINRCGSPTVKTVALSTVSGAMFCAVRYARSGA